MRVRHLHMCKVVIFPLIRMGCPLTVCSYRYPRTI